MEFIQIAYCFIAPFLLIVAKLHYDEKAKRLGANLLATANLLLIFYSCFLLKQMIGLYHLVKQTAAIFEVEQPSAPGSLRWFFFRQAAVILLPVLFLWKRFRAGIFLPGILLVLLFWDHPMAVWNTYGIEFKIASYLCLFCSGYALLWLLHSLPHQSSPQ